MRRGEVRIIAGRLRRRRLAVPPGNAVRPTSDRLRETLFNVLGPSVPGASVIDGFAGTGALGLEAISRGAAQVLFVETDPQTLGILEENLRRCGVEGGYAIARCDFLDLGALDRPAGNELADLVLLDPPYAYPHLEAALEIAAGLLAPSGLVVLEHDRRRQSPVGAGRLRRVRVLVAGESALSFYQPVDAGPDHS